MASDWIKMRAGIETNPNFLRLLSVTGLSAEGAMAALYRLASWFSTHSKYGKISSHYEGVIDAVAGVPGISKHLEDVGWLRRHETSVTLHWFCDASARRKSLGKKVRQKVLSAGQCAICGATRNLTVDHIVPICLGGSCELSNLQCLCELCNRSKGRKTMEQHLRSSQRDMHHE